MQSTRSYQIWLPPNEERLMRDFRNGHQATFKQIYKATIHELMGYCINKNWDGSVAECEDIVAETYYRLFRDRQKIESYDHLRRRLFVSAMHLIINDHRLRGTKRIYLRDTYTSQQTSTQDNQPNLELFKQLIDQKLADMGKLMKGKVVYLLFLKSKNSLETANILGINRQTVLNHKTKGLDAIRKDVTKTNLEPVNIKTEVKQLFMAFQG